MKQNNVKIKFILLILSVLVLTLMNMCMGSADISPATLVKVFMGKCGDEVAVNIITKIRLPRTIAAFFTGSALALSGYMLQNFFKNPIAGPFILGISSGAKLFVALLFVAAGGGVISYFSQIGAALLGAFIVVIFVLALSRRIGSMPVLLVCGVMVGYICNAITDIVVTFAEDKDIVNLHNWSKGSLSGIGTDKALILGICISLSYIAAFLIAKPMQAYIMGESLAASLGVNVKAFRVMLIIISSLLAALVTAFIGPVSFVGIAVPHLVRAGMKGADTKVMITGCLLLGGAFCLLCDLLARCLMAPSELTLSTVTAVFGAPVVIYLVIKRRMR